MAISHGKGVFESMWESFPEAVLLMNSQRRIQGCNHRAEELFGGTRQEILGRALTDFLPFSDEVKSSFETPPGQPRLAHKGESFCLTGERSTRWFEWSIHPVLGSVPGEPAWVMVATDITERKNAERFASLQHSLLVRLLAVEDMETALGIILDTAIQLDGIDSGAIYVVDRRKQCMNMVTFRGLSPAFVERVSHLPLTCPRGRLALCGQPIYGSHRAVEPDPDEVLLDEGLRTVAIIPVSYRGELVAVLNLSSRSLEDIPVGMRLIAERLAAEVGGVVARVRAEQEHRLLHTLLESHVQFLGIAELSGNFVYINQAGRALAGLGSSEPIDELSVFDLVPDSHRQTLRDAVFPRLLVEGRYSGESALAQRGTGRAFEIDFHSFLIRSDLEGEPLHIALIIEDLTDRRKLEGQLVQAQKMESLGRLAGGVAHDFNNCLTGIKGNLSLALLDLPAGQPAHHSVIEAQRAAERAEGLVRQLLAFSRRQEIEPRVLDLNDLISQLSRMLARTLGEDIQLVNHLDPKLGKIQVDAGQIEQILVNLAVNSRDAMPAGGKLFIETAAVNLDQRYADTHPMTRAGPHVLLSISDTGCGMNPEIKARIFEPFFTTKEKGKGTGLGLSIVFGAVKQNNGTIEVYSEPDKGTTFKMFFPVHEGEMTRSAPEGDPLAAMPTGREIALYVEDESVVRDVTREVLERLGYHVLCCKNSEEALEVETKWSGPIHILISDIIMPGMNGRALAERLLQRRSRLKILFTSGYTEEVIAHHGILRDGVHFLSKPYSMQNLARKVREVLDG